MKKSFVRFSLWFSFLVMFGISLSEAATPKTTICQSPDSTVEDMRSSVFQRTLFMLDSVADSIQQEEFGSNPVGAVERLGREIPDNADIYVLDALRITFTERIINLISGSLNGNIVNVLRATASLEAVTQAFHSRRT